MSLITCLNWNWYVVLACVDLIIDPLIHNNILQLWLAGYMYMGRSSVGAWVVLSGVAGEYKLFFFSFFLTWVDHSVFNTVLPWCPGLSVQTVGHYSNQNWLWGLWHSLHLPQWSEQQWKHCHAAPLFRYSTFGYFVVEQALDTSILRLYKQMKPLSFVRVLHGALSRTIWRGKTKLP